ncbi:hypothetical protein A3A54_01615 [Candidatus Curtissbacteria bacterium RIFCSPLOWO2_01_FULL_39_62]|uniref:YqgF/RNase H-like domain-containing protein n=2 Tax=Candidatus Curtissiibacteriota TaxID=1752717 RepID=A0A1F5G7Q4_9BACT|nr:MAG: hypothetical protein A2775_00970 [Candidatus Curtissbacteria bacterium RIFCSPHIGHO2_01_FULL_39_57]OGD87845.1 MAG: hypothetical protein A3D04_02655 [Candidatus Curtissbacteria bacterium RIFCSPHIGHO2_02_FULL_40_16b]OGD90407.1 MAG: hypothetical protein A3E11_00125 [Candidatus Curtissbacteria bacterium RIFCSPHIGHO2_12_FULL_38_37]OGD99785.1 MAG: hypothetical protein A3J17_04350 [Candidatus Curtissbacteria bacterium RIFCSPLOWO2_02_FULL_40_11]OGE00840.1 MAG: hypothetical protein A3A54_01615 [C
MILGIDLGQKTTGLAISEGELATSHSTITHKSLTEAVSKVILFCDQNQVDTVIIGYVEGKNKIYFEKFREMLENKNSNLKTVMWDETLTTRQAISIMVKLGVPRQKRREKEHEVAASLILQSYLDSK